MNDRYFLLLLACSAILPSCKKSSPKITQVPESESQRSEAVKAAFLEGDPAAGNRIDPGKPEFAEVDAFLAKLGAAARKKDHPTYRDCLSVDAMVRNLEAKGMVSFKYRRERADFIKGAESSIGKSMGTMAFDSHTVARLEEIAPNQMMAFTRAFNDDMKIVVKMRWWLLKEEGEWKIYDFEELTQGARASTLMGAMIVGTKGKKKVWIEPMLEMSRMLQGMNSDNVLEQLASLRDLSEKVLNNSPPQEVEVFARHTLVTGMLAGDDAAAALIEIEKLEKLPNISPGVHFMKGCALSATDKQAEARAAFERYVDLLGWDCDAHEMMADSYLAEGKQDEALDQALKGLADQKDATGCLATAAVAAGAERLGELEKYFDASSDPEAAYEAVIDYALEREDVEIGKAVLALLKKKYPVSDLVETYQEIFAEGDEVQEE